MKKIWIFLSNTFLNVTESSNRLALRISAKHDAALQAAAAGGDLFFIDMYASYHPIHLALKTAYDIWVAQGGTQESQTLTLKQLLRLLSGTKADLWMTTVKILHDKTTARFKELFPDLKNVFQEGSQQQIIEAVNAFSIAIGSEAGLATLKTEVDAFHALLTTAYSVQKGSISTTGIKSNAIETARVNSGVAQYGDLGLLMNKFSTNPLVIANYFDEAAIREGNQVIFHHHVKPLKIYNVCKHTSKLTDELLLENDGDSTLIFALALQKADNLGPIIPPIPSIPPDPGYVFVSVTPHSNKTVHASDLTNDLTNNHFLVCYNPDPLIEGVFTVEFL